MTDIKFNKLSKAETEILLIIPWIEIKKTFDEVVDDSAKRMELKGFRKGKAPKKLVEENLDHSKVYSRVVEIVVPRYYQEALNTNNLHPICSPKITLASAKEGENWQIKILIAEKPEIKLGGFKEELRKLNQSGKIWLPGQTPEKEEEKDQQKRKEEKTQAVIKWLLENIKVELSDLLLNEEVNRRLSELIDQTARLGLTVEQYLASSGKTAEAIRAEYKKQAQDLFSLEFILSEISESEKIVVDNQEIEQIVQKAPSEEEKKNLGAQKYLLASILRRQKALDFLTNL